MIKYVELKSGQDDKGPAWIGRVEFSKSGQTIYFNGKAFSKSSGQGIEGNYYDVETGDEYWISGIKKDGQDRHWAGSGKIAIEATVVEEYLKLRGLTQLDPSKFIVSESFPKTDRKKFHEIQNEKLEE